MEAINATGSKDERRIGKSYMKADQELLDGIGIIFTPSIGVNN